MSVSTGSISLVLLLPSVTAAHPPARLLLQVADALTLLVVPAGQGLHAAAAVAAKVPGLHAWQARPPLGSE